MREVELASSPGLHHQLAVLEAEGGGRGKEGGGRREGGGRGRREGGRPGRFSHVMHGATITKHHLFKPTS